jgi:hypothetical protein
MYAQKLFFYCLLFCSIAFPKGGGADPVICDPMQPIRAVVQVAIDNDVLAELQDLGVNELSITPGTYNSWTEKFPAKNGAEVTIVDYGDPLTIDMQEGLLVTYKTCENDIVYAFCQIPEQDLQGQYPETVRLHLNPAFKRCCIEVLTTQCF